MSSFNVIKRHYAVNFKSRDPKSEMVYTFAASNEFSLIGAKAPTIKWSTRYNADI